MSTILLFAGICACFLRYTSSDPAFLGIHTGKSGAYDILEAGRANYSVLCYLIG